MKINRLLDPDTTGANGTAVVEPVVTPAPTPAPATPVAPTNPGDAAKAARAERLSRDIFEEPGDEATKPVVPATTEAAKPTPAAAPVVQMTPEMLREVMGRPQPQVQAAPQLTQAEIDTQLGVVKVTPEMCVEMGLPAEAAPFLDKFQKAIVTNSVRMANVIVQQQMAELNGRLQPHITFAQQQQHLLLEHQFNEEFPDLKGYDPIIKDVAAKLKASGFKGSQKEAFTKIGEGARAYLKTMNLTPASANNGTTTNAVVTSPKPTMSTVSAGSQGGAGGAPKGNAKESWQDVWEK